MRLLGPCAGSWGDGNPRWGWSASLQPAGALRALTVGIKQAFTQTSERHTDGLNRRWVKMSLPQVPALLPWQASCLPGGGPRTSILPHSSACRSWCAGVGEPSASRATEDKPGQPCLKHGNHQRHLEEQKYTLSYSVLILYRTPARTNREELQHRSS